MKLFATIRMYWRYLVSRLKGEGKSYRRIVLERERSEAAEEEQRKLLMQKIGWSGDFDSFKVAFVDKRPPINYFSDEQIGCVRTDGTTYPLSDPLPTEHRNVGMQHQALDQYRTVVYRVEYPETGQTIDKVVKQPIYEPTQVDDKPKE